MNTIIVSTDHLYSEMLLLELKRHGFSAHIIECTENTATCAPMIIDADSTSRDVIDDIISSAPGTILFSRDIKLGESIKSRRGKNSAYFCFLRRPFRTEAFITSVNEMADHLCRDNIITIDKQSRTVHIRGNSVSLTDQEFRLFSLLEEKRGTPISRDEALRRLTKEKEIGGNIVDVYIRYLRTKLEAGFGDPMIRTIRGKGYMLP